MEWFGIAAVAFAVLGVISTRIGVRLPVVRQHVVEATGVLGLVVAVDMSSLRLLLTALTPDLSRFSEVTTVPALILFVLLPMALIGRSARRCLRAA